MAAAKILHNAITRVISNKLGRQLTGRGRWFACPVCGPGPESGRQRLTACPDSGRQINKIVQIALKLQ